MPDEKLPYQEQAPIAKNKPAVLDNPQAPDSDTMTRRQALIRRNALVDELFRVVPKTHPPKPRIESKAPESATDIVEKKDVPDLEGQKIESQEKDRKLHSINGVTLNLYDYFDIDVNTNSMETLRRLQFVNSWVATEGRTFEEGMRKLHTIDTKLGSSDTGETKLIKLYNWLKFSGRR